MNATPQTTTDIPKTLAGSSCASQHTYSYLYPGLGERRPAGGALVLLLTVGGVCVTGTWAGDGRYLGWCSMPSRAQYAYPALERTPASVAGSGELLLLTAGGVCVFGPWADDGRYLGWSKKPQRDRAKEDALRAIEALAKLPGPVSPAVSPTGAGAAKGYGRGAASSSQGTSSKHREAQAA